MTILLNAITAAAKAFTIMAVILACAFAALIFIHNADKEQRPLQRFGWIIASLGCIFVILVMVFLGDRW